MEISEATLEETKAVILDKYTKAGQEHVLEHWSTLSKEEQTLLLEQLQSIDVEKLEGYHTIAKLEDKSLMNEESIKPFSGKIGSLGSASGDGNSLYELGMNAIRENKVAAVLLAGGQGTRLGFDGPKGMYDIGMTSGSTLFCWIAQRLLKLSQLAVASSSSTSTTATTTTGVKIPLYIMTSPMNHQSTKEYFESNDYFGLDSNDVTFFAQGVLPCLSPNGKILLETPYQCAMAPDGNGGIYPAMEKCGVMKDMSERGIEHIHTFAIDNALVKPADPTFIGYCIQQNADCGNKVLWKKDPHEKVGVIAEKNGNPCVVEYSELSKEMAEKRTGADSDSDLDSKLAFGAANICNHYYSLSFLKDKAIPNLGNMFHIANKKIGVWDDEKKETIVPSTNNGIKLESFIFDVFPLSTSMAIFEVDRKHEFAPVKNAPGAKSDSPDTARAMMTNMVKEWIVEAGGTLGGDMKSDKCEIGPLMSYGGEGLDEYKGKTVECPFSL